MADLPASELDELPDAMSEMEIQAGTRVIGVPEVERSLRRLGLERARR